MNWSHLAAGFLAIALLIPQWAQSQFGPPGGGGPRGGSFGPPGGPPGGSFGPPGGSGFSRGGGAPDPNRFFDMLAKGKEVIDRNDLDPPFQMMFDRMTQRAGITGTRLTREQFTEMTQKAMAARANGGGTADGGTPPGGDSTPAAKDPETVTREAEGWFKRFDRDGDGKLSLDEMSDKMKADRDKYDTNKDGLIDFDEYKQFYSASFTATPSEGGSLAPGSMAPLRGAPEPVEDPRPTVFRVGKLPKELPSWFAQLDTDLDGQVGLYEWRKGGKAIGEFLDSDINSDGLLTAEEVMKGIKETAQMAKKPGSEAVATGTPGAGEAASGGMSRFVGGSPPGGGSDRGDRGSRTRGPSGSGGPSGFTPPSDGGSGRSQRPDRSSRPRPEDGSGGGRTEGSSGGSSRGNRPAPPTR